MEFRVLGPLEVGDGDGTSAPTRDKERRLLALLLARANEVVSADQVAEALWGDDGQPAQVVRAVQTHVSRLRAALGTAGERLASRPPGYLLRVEPGELDADRFERLVGDARRNAAGDAAAALAVLDEALELWRGPPYGELRDEDFAIGDAVRLEELRIVAIEERVEALLALGRHDDVVGELEARCAEHPLRERLRGQLMLALHRSGRQAEALRAFESYRRMLADELGLEPSQELRTLEARILAHDPELRLPRPATGAPARVRLPVTSFVGRERELDDVVRTLSSARLLTITGPGGVGKSRLALHAAAALADRFADGVVVCELAAVADEAAVAPAVATALGILPRRDRSIEESLADVLRAKAMLLVLDGCEHVARAAAAVLTSLVTHCPRVALLATSRARLGIAGERLVRIPPLEPGDAVELFCERALSLRADLDCEGPARAHIAETCRRLDGLPLAIELAAAQVTAMNPADIAHRLDDRFRLLDRGAAGPGRHPSLRAAVDSSFELLDDPHRSVFERLSVFSGTFTLDAAEQVCAGEGVDGRDVPGLVADLADASLVILAGGEDRARYRLLETLRTYGRDRLRERGGADRWRDRHLGAQIAEARTAELGLRTAEEGRWVRQLDAGLDDLREAHRWAVERGDAVPALALAAALHGYGYRTMRHELFAWAEAAARLPGADGHPLLPIALGSAATGGWARGDLEGAKRLAEEALAAAGDAPSGHLGCHALAGEALFRGDLDTAETQSRRGGMLAAEAGDAYFACIGAMVATLARAYGGAAEEAETEAERNLAEARRLDCPSVTSWGLYHVGEVLLDRDPQRALAALDEARTLAAEVGHVFLLGVAGTSAVTLRARQDDAEQALRDFPELIDLWDRLGNWTQQWTLLRSLIGTLARLGQDQTAAVLAGAMRASSTAPPVYGADAERLAAAFEAMERRAGAGQVAAWVERGRGLHDADVVPLARAACAR